MDAITLASLLGKLANIALTIGPSLLSLKNYEEEGDKLVGSIEFIGSVLSYTESVRFNGSPPVIIAYNRLREAYLDAEDFMDELRTRKMMKQYAKDKEKMEKKANQEIPAHGILAKAQAGFSYVQNKAKKTVNDIPIPICFKLHDDIKKTREELVNIRMDSELFELMERFKSNPTSTRRKERVFNPESIIGRDEDVSIIIENLLVGSYDIISVVGMGGIGKTTVARLVFEDTRVKDAFDLKLWVPVSQKCDLKLLVQKILKSIFPRDTRLQNLEMNNLQDELEKKIRGKKYLIVLDDVDHEDSGVWYGVEHLLKQGAKGSRTLVTTRSKIVAKEFKLDSTSHELDGLSKEDSWSLFVNSASRDKCIDKTLIGIGKSIVEKCRGVPLAIETIGSLLYGKNIRVWQRVMDTDLAKIEDDRNDIIPILRISYDALEPQCKELFRYCALFVRGEYISKELLFEIWMSFATTEGKPTQSVRAMLKDRNFGFFTIMENLCDRCLLEESEDYSFLLEYEDDDLKGYFYKMHDLMYDMAKEVAGADVLVVDSNVTSDLDILRLENIRHLRFTSSCGNEEISNIFEPQKAKRLRSLLQDVDHPRIWHGSWAKLLSVDNIIMYFPVLRMLDLWGLKIESLPDGVGKLIHLRYLKLSGNNFRTLPKSISNLWNLQYLLLNECKKLEKLPEGIGELVNLEHLDVTDCDALTHPMPCGMGALTSLRSINKFIVGPSKSKDTAKLEDLEPLAQLQGELRIFLPDNGSKKADSSQQVLLKKGGLRELSIEWSIDSRKDTGNERETIFTKLQPHPNLEDLSLKGYDGLSFPSWGHDFASSLPNLVTICIERCGSCQHLPSFSTLMCLKFLTISGLSSLEYIEEKVPAADAPFFPSLIELELQRVPKLKGWCMELAGVEEQFSQLPHFPSSLHFLRIYSCPDLKMTSMPALSFREYSLEEGRSGNFIFTLNIAAPVGNDQGAASSSSSSSSALRFSGVFYTDDLHVYVSTPWEQCLSGNPVSIKIDFFTKKGVETHDTFEAFFRRMSKLLTSVSLREAGHNLQTLLGWLQHLTDLQRLEINEDCFSYDENKERHQPQHKFNRLQYLRLGCRSIVRLPNELRDLTSLRDLCIIRCNGLVLPIVLQGFINLEFLFIWEHDRSLLETHTYQEFGITNETLLLSSTKYERLKKLELYDVSSLIYMQDNNSGAFSFPSLIEVTLSSLPKFRDWCSDLDSTEIQQQFPRLSLIETRNCPEFNHNSMLLSTVELFQLGAPHRSVFEDTRSLPSGSFCWFKTNDEDVLKKILQERNELCLTIVEARHASTFTEWLDKIFDRERLPNHKIGFRLVKRR